MGVVVTAIGVLAIIVALFAAIGLLLCWADGDSAWFGVWAVVLVVVAVLMVPVIRQGSWMVSAASCDGVSANNESLDVRHLELTYWDFGCYVDTGNGVIPWGRYRAVIEG